MSEKSLIQHKGYFYECFFAVGCIGLHYIVRCHCAPQGRSKATHHHYKMMHWDTVCSDIKGHTTKCGSHMMMHGHCLMTRSMSINSAE